MWRVMDYLNTYFHPREFFETLILRDYVISDMVRLNLEKVCLIYCVFYFLHKLQHYKVSLLLVFLGVSIRHH